MMKSGGDKLILKARIVKIIKNKINNIISIYHIKIMKWKIMKWIQIRHKLI
jgi:hypothetical protein